MTHKFIIACGTDHGIPLLRIYEAEWNEKTLKWVDRHSDLLIPAREVLAVHDMEETAAAALRLAKDIERACRESWQAANVAMQAAERSMRNAMTLACQFGSEKPEPAVVPTACELRDCPPLYSLPGACPICADGPCHYRKERRETHTQRQG